MKIHQYEAPTWKAQLQQQVIMSLVWANVFSCTLRRPCFKDPTFKSEFLRKSSFPYKLNHLNHHAVVLAFRRSTQCAKIEGGLRLVVTWHINHSLVYKRGDESWWWSFRNLHDERAKAKVKSPSIETSTYEFSVFYICTRIMAGPNTVCALP